ncbi:hypothetical protein HOLleu_36007 [Holothuria leucospilota]|uniref:Uncharacterized protein n=1 Tax=Holothuria leucospilota TaxID=206669 RepID=A0A9Q1BED3_HOLLE|nr:hypothetical protein HOLleu_36007 [Holothuria leucospilota]
MTIISSSQSFETQSAHRRGIIAEHMAHKEATQAHYYRACISADMACEASVTITSLLDGTSLPSAQQQAPASTHTRPGTSGLPPPRQVTPPPLFDSDNTRNSDDNDDEDYVPPSSPVQCDKKGKRERASFSLEEIEKIMALYNTKRKSFSTKANIKNIVSKCQTCITIP